ncbi:MAG: polysaccharide deacetylase family protein [Oscillospiraceae bacterium]|nr:polysaccharide deacetylase family protein [Oscillospiraceae bacterium]
MKLRKMIILCVIVALASCLVLFAGCQPNVNNGGAGSGTTPLITTPRQPSTTTTTHGAPHANNRNPAVGGTSSTAFTYDEKDLITAEPEPNKDQLETEPFLPVAAPVINLSELSGAKIGWGLGKSTDSQNRPSDALTAQSKYGDLNAVFIDGETENKLYLTFDEGYENGYTSVILDALGEKGVKATFFVTYDYCRTEGELIRRMIAEGHEVGNHSWSHPSFPGLTETEVKEEIQKLHDYVKENFDYEMRLIRFPMGEFSEKVLAITQSMGYSSVFWSFAYVDWDVNSQPPVDEAFQKITEATHPGGVFLLHAVSKTNADILSDLIEYWFRSGLKPSLIG